MDGELSGSWRNKTSQTLYYKKIYSVFYSQKFEFFHTPKLWFFGKSVFRSMFNSDYPANAKSLPSSDEDEALKGYSQY